MTYLTGKCLVSMPNNDDDEFSHSLIYICSHNKEGAFGFIVNKNFEDLSFSDLISQLCPDKPLSFSSIGLHQGGPIEKVRGFVLHSTDYLKKDTVVIDKDVAVSSSIEVLNDIASGDGPKCNIIALGYSSWAPEQLETEIKNNLWMVVDSNLDLVFNTNDDEKWQKAMSNLGINVAHLSSVCGHA